MSKHFQSYNILNKEELYLTFSSSLLSNSLSFYTLLIPIFCLLILCNRNNNEFVSYKRKNKWRSYKLEPSKQCRRDKFDSIINQPH